MPNNKKELYEYYNRVNNDQKAFIRRQIASKVNSKKVINLYLKSLKVNQDLENVYRKEINSARNFDVYEAFRKKVKNKEYINTVLTENQAKIIKSAAINKKLREQKEENDQRSAIFFGNWNDMPNHLRY